MELRLTGWDNELLNGVRGEKKKRRNGGSGESRGSVTERWTGDKRSKAS